MQKPRQEMIEAIYARFANKTIQPGCMYIHNGQKFEVLIETRVVADAQNKEERFYQVRRTEDNTIIELQDYEIQYDKIIGSAVYIGDVLKQRNGSTTVMTLTQGLRRDLEKSIDCQSDLCILFVYNLK